MTPEGRVKKMVKKALDILGDDCWRFMPVQTGFGSPALDFLLSVRGRFVAIETKAPGKKLTPLQEGTKAAIEAAGGIVLTVWDETSLALAVKIIFALEFAPNVPQQQNHTDHLADCLKVEKANYTGDWHAKRIKPEPENKRPRPEHLRKGYASFAVDKAVSGDHGAPRKEPE